MAEDRTTDFPKVCHFCGQPWGGCVCGFPAPGEDIDDNTPGFEWFGCRIVNPTVDETAFAYVNPVVYYGQDFLNWWSFYTQRQRQPMRTNENAVRVNGTKVPGVTLGGNMNGTSLRGEFVASFAQLRALLGDPNSDGDGYKVSTEWVLTFRGSTFTIYDYKATALYDDEPLSVEAFRGLPSYSWHVGAPSVAAPQTVLDFIRAMLDAVNGYQPVKSAEPRKLPAGARDLDID